MGTAERRQREKELRREEIIQAAEEIFFKHGYVKSTLDQIAEASQLAKGTLYLYFKSKEDLYFAVIGRGYKLLIKKFQDVASKKKLGAERIRALGKAGYDFSLEYPDYFNTFRYQDTIGQFLSQPSPNEAVCHQMEREIFQWVLDALILAQEDGSVNKVKDPIKTSLILFKMMWSLLNNLQIKDHLLDEEMGFKPKDIYFSSVDILMSGLGESTPKTK